MNQTLLIVALAAVAFAAGFLLLHAVAPGYAAYRRRFTDVARKRLEEAFVFINPNLVFLVPVIGVAVLAPGLWLLTGDLVWPIIIAVAALAGPSVYFHFKHRKRKLDMVMQLPDVLLMLGSSLRSGTSLQIAMDLAIRETPAPLSQELGVVVREQRLGMAMEDALESMARRLKLEEIDLVVSAMTIARDVGGNLAETLDRLAVTLRAKATMEGKIRALTSQGKLQGLIVGLLPIGLMVALSFLQHDAMAPLFNTVLGYAVLGFIGIVELFGFWWIRKIVSIDV